MNSPTPTKPETLGVSGLEGFAASLGEACGRLFGFCAGGRVCGRTARLVRTGLIEEMGRGVSTLHP